MKIKRSILASFSVTESIGIFGELYGDISPDNSAVHFWDAGLTFSLRPNLQLDAYAGTGINAPQDLALGTGISFRIPK